MLEKVGSKDIVVQNYTSNFDIKEFMQEVLIPKAFPNIPITKLNLGFTGVVSEMISQGIEDAAASAALMINESFISRAVLPSSIEADAAIYGLGYSYATPTQCNFALEIWLDDIVNNSTVVQGTSTKRYVVDRDTKLILGKNTYSLDYDIIIDWQIINGKRVFNVYYDMSETNSMSPITNKYVKHQTTTTGWLVLFFDLRAFNRKTDEASITDNLVTTNSDISISWVGQIAGIDVMYISPQGQRIPLTLKQQYTKPDVNPFAWYRFIDDNMMTLSFTSNAGYWSPEFNSKIEWTVYTCDGSAANFDSYDRRTEIPVQKSGERYAYNADTRMVALCYSGSTGGLDRGDIEELRDRTILAYNTANVLTTEHDLQLWFETNAKKYGTKAKFFKRRDDPSGKLFSQFIAIVQDNYIYPTNSLSIEVPQNDFDYVNSSIVDGKTSDDEFIIKPGHLWEYQEDSLDTLQMIKNVDGNPAFVTDDTLPIAGKSFVFTNPFFIKIHRNPTTSMNYNYLIDHTSWPEDIPVDTGCFYQFQLGTFHIERTLSSTYKNMYHIEVVCVPVITESNITYVEGVGEEFDKTKNNLRLVLITRTALDGETGYIEMTPTELRAGGAILFEADIAVHDNIQSDMMLEVDTSRTPMTSLITNDNPRSGKIYMDSDEASFHFAVMMKDSTTAGDALFGDPSFEGYVMTNRFCNSHRDLTLYKPMSMMRSTITFAGSTGNYVVTASLIPFLKYDIALDNDKMSYFIRAFDDQYAAVEPVLSKLDGNSYIDYKLYNTYGKSSNYYIGPKDNNTPLRDSDILLDNVYVKIKLRIAVYDRSMYTQTVNDIINRISQFFDSLNSGDSTDIHASDIINVIMENLPNVKYVRFLGFNEYDANKQSIFVKYTDISDLNEEQLSTRVPEIIRVDANSIDITEET